MEWIGWSLWLCKKVEPISCENRSFWKHGIFLPWHQLKRCIFILIRILVDIKVINQNSRIFVFKSRALNAHNKFQAIVAVLCLMKLRGVETEHCPKIGWFTLTFANIYLFKVNNRNTRKMCVICSKLTIKTPERRRLFLLFLLLTLNK